jgi:hypothetical protein
MASDNLNEKRLTRRFSCLLYGNFKSDADHRGLALFQNVSETGLMLKAYDTLIPGQELEINIRRQNSMVFSLSGQVRWCRKEGDYWRAGISFREPAVFDLSRIA